MMLFNSTQFLVFFPCVLFVYFVIPKKLRYIWLLLCSYYFYMSWNIQYAVLIALSTIITYLGGIALQYISNSQKHSYVWKKIILAVTIILNIGILVFFKYFVWILATICTIFSVTLPFHISIILPVGISFYTFQAVGYMIDVNRGTVKAERNFIRYALFISFFPQLVAGPIERAKNLLTQIDKLHELKRIDFAWMRDGLCLMLWGYFQKLVIADRVMLLVDHVFEDYLKYGFIELSITAVLFAFQIYCDLMDTPALQREVPKFLGLGLWIISVNLTLRYQSVNSGKDGIYP